MLAPEIQQLVAQVNALNIDYSHLTPLEVRKITQIFFDQLPHLKNPGVSIVNQTITLSDRDIGIRIYTPKSTNNKNMPVVFYFHGGGFVWGKPEFLDDISMLLANDIPAKIISIDYRYAPEYPFPAAFNDCYEALQYILKNAAKFNIDSNKIAVAGDSAGGNLAAAICLKAREAQDFKIAAQLLLYPWLDDDFTTSSYQTMGQGYLLTTTSMKWYGQHYLPHAEDRNNPFALPAKAKNMSGLPPALIVTAKYDPLCDEGKSYATRLKAAGNTAEYMCCEDMIHGLASYGAVSPAAEQAIHQIVQRFARLFLSSAV